MYFNLNIPSYTIKDEVKPNFIHTITSSNLIEMRWVSLDTSEIESIRVKHKLFLNHPVFWSYPFNPTYKKWSILVISYFKTLSIVL